MSDLQRGCNLRQRSIFFFVLSFIVAKSALAQSSDDIVWIEYPEAGVVLGQGYNLLNDQTTYGTCVNFVPVQDPSQEISYNFNEVTSTTDIKSKLNISASGSLKMAILKASARLQFLTDEKFNLETKKFHLQVNVVNSAAFAAPSPSYKVGARNIGISEIVPALNDDDAAEEFDISDLVNGSIEISAEDKENVSKCGHGFVAAVVSGASLDAFITYTNSDSKSLTDIQGGLEADIAGIFTVKGSLESRQEHDRLQKSTNIRVFKSGGVGSAISYDYDSLKSSLSQITTDAVSSPKPIRIGIVPYSALNQLPNSETISAQNFSKAVAAFFLVRDVFEKTSSIIDRHYSADPIATRQTEEPIYIHSFDKYLELNSRSLNLLSKISKVLTLCREEANEANAALAADDATRTRFEPFLAQVVSQPEFRIRTSPTEGNEQNLVSASTVNERFDTDMNALQERGGDVEAKASACSIDDQTDGSEKSFLSLAIDEGIELTAQEIAHRPVYWSELSASDRRKIAALVLGVIELAKQNNQNPDEFSDALGDGYKQFTDKMNDILSVHVKINSSSRLFRQLCSRNIDNPICAFSQSEFIEMSKPTVSVSGVKFTVVRDMSK